MLTVFQCVTMEGWTNVLYYVSGLCSYMGNTCIREYQIYLYEL